VEHPVTETVTGVDLVAMQIDLARGTLDRPAQADIATRGHAIECRLYAENPAKMFMPSPGTLDIFQMPDDITDIRIDAGYREGDEITPFYDPMIAKLIAWGEDRDAARARAAEALRAMRIEGIRNNREFLIACLEDTLFAAGDVHTGFIDARQKLLLAA
jgi:acetyl/propionyl-CoA carboxylase alpha subunit